LRAILAFGAKIAARQRRWPKRGPLTASRTAQKSSAVQAVS
jgi:hypothetical protein